MKKCLVLGGSNIDIIGYSYGQLIRKDSNPGCVNFSYGGVGRNIAVNMKKMGLDVSMITAFGNDSFRNLLVEDFRLHHINIENSFFSERYPSSVYLCVLDEEKDLDLAINSMDVIDEIDDLNFLKEKISLINDHDYVLIDGNLSVESITFLMGQIKSKIVVDGVSSIKVVKFKNVLECIDAIKINRLEASALLGVEINSEDDLISAGKELVDRGINQVYITDGSNGSFAFQKESYFKFKVDVRNVVNVTGAGDTFTAGVVYGLSNDFALDEILQFSSFAARYTLESEQTISDDLNVREILDEMNINR